MTNSDPMPIKSLAPRFGGKRTLAPRIVAELGEHRAYWEPFCGGISVLLQKPRVRQEVINDLHGDATNLAIVCASDRWFDLHAMTLRTLYSEGVYDAAKESISDREFDFARGPESVTDEHVKRAAAYLILSWMGRNGAAGTARINYQFTLRYTGNGGDSATRWRQVIESLPAWHDRLQGVVITRRNGVDLAEKIDDAPGVAIYADPPYIEEGDAYEHAFHSGGGMFGDDHQRLAEILNSKKSSRVVVSYYDHPRLRELYPGWTIVNCAMTKALSAQNKRGMNRESAPEVLLINGVSHTEGKWPR